MDSLTISSSSSKSQSLESNDGSTHAEYNSRSQVDQNSLPHNNSLVDTMVTHSKDTTAAIQSEPSDTDRVLADIRQLVTMYPSLAFQISKQGLQMRDVSVEIAPVQPSKFNIDPTLLGLPRELRNQILGYLVTDPDLGRVFPCLNDFSDPGTSQKYDLHPEILRVNKQLNAEGEELLYSQIFYYGCVNGLGRLGPLAQYLERFRYHKPLRSMASAMKVRRWLVVISSCDEEWASSPVWYFKDFCRAVAIAKPVSLVVALLPKEIDQDIVEEHNSLSEILALKMLRNVAEGTIDIRAATKLECPRVLRRNSLAESVPDMDANIISQIKKEISCPGEPQVEKLEEMMDCLLKYAQTFEHCENFKKHMVPGVSVRKHSPADFNPFRGKTTHPVERGPYWGTMTHPVERGLERAAYAVREDDTAGFKQERAEILAFLEKQYQRASAAFFDLRTFIEDQRCGLFKPGSKSPDLYYQYSDVFVAMRYLHPYATALLSRDSPPEILIQIAKVQSRFNQQYVHLEHRVVLNRLNLAFEYDDWDGFTDLYRNSVDLFDDQFIMIQKARQSLFIYDLGDDHGCDVDPELSSCTKKIDWNYDTASICTSKKM